MALPDLPPEAFAFAVAIFHDVVALQPTKASHFPYGEPHQRLGLLFTIMVAKFFALESKLLEDSARPIGANIGHC
ncbi:uncharacterized protein BDR25DRAFT_42198 [Lindgomyces ingoldianus]|uniref:Uncharacterized protein n=1 Tax=Lindgomyces ingoldianus TaxID=673940 RepID=A0ACB6RD02_9PLEO|nr:uncharacterized protein BDR25DRAFT_42198 [Lindgomyces ingoldianus]KAF2476925.1 hypothetical protein BDR25DRAFT_42198 [Lindgomyces ingoldianus]